MRSADVSEARRRREPRQPLHHQAIVIDRDRSNPRAAREERRTHARIARLLDPHVLPGIQEHSGNEFERPLCPGDDDHLVGGTARSAGAANVIGNRLAECGDVGGIGVIEMRQRRRTQPACDELRPTLHGKENRAQGFRVEARGGPLDERAAAGTSASRAPRRESGGCFGVAPEAPRQFEAGRQAGWMPRMFPSRAAPADTPPPAVARTRAASSSSRRRGLPRVRAKTAAARRASGTPSRMARLMAP